MGWAVVCLQQRSSLDGFVMFDYSFLLSIVRSALCLLCCFGSISAGFATFAASLLLEAFQSALGSLSDIFATVCSPSLLFDSL